MTTPSRGMAHWTQPGTGRVRKAAGRILAEGHTPGGLAEAIKYLANEIDALEAARPPEPPIHTFEMGMRQWLDELDEARRPPETPRASGDGSA